MFVRAVGPVGTTSRGPVYEDVQPGAWHYNEVAQAKELGLLDFVEGNRLFPNQPLTREEMASMAAAAIRREMESLPEKTVNLNRYRDLSDIEEAHLEDVRLMVTLGIMLGTGADQFSPKGETTRAQAAVVLLKTLGVLGWLDIER